MRLGWLVLLLVASGVAMKPLSFLADFDGKHVDEGMPWVSNGVQWVDERNGEEKLHVLQTDGSGSLFGSVGFYHGSTFYRTGIAHFFGIAFINDIILSRLAHQSLWHFFQCLISSSILGTISLTFESLRFASDGATDDHSWCLWFAQGSQFLSFS